MKRIGVLMVVSVAIFMAGMAFAAEKGTAKEAKAMVDAAASYLKANDPTKAYAEFNDKSGRFVNKDLYIFAVDFNGITLAHGGNKALIGKNMGELRDSNGKLFIKEMIEVSKAKGSGWVDYNWSNPTTRKIESKSTYVQRVGDLFLGCGIYKSK